MRELIQLCSGITTDLHELIMKVGITICAAKVMTDFIRSHFRNR